MEKQSMLIIGGSGIVGQQMAMEASMQGYDVASIGLEYSQGLPASVDQHVCDRHEPGAWEALASRSWDVVFDVISFSRADVAQTLQRFGKDAHTFFLSTALVYEPKRPNNVPIPSDYPLARKGQLSGYVDRKLEVEEAVREIGDAMRCTILRPYHILGPGSVVGCVPRHNRDPFLPEHIRNGKQLDLCEGILSIVHPRDIAKTVLAAAGKDATFGKAYNVVHAEHPTSVEEYHRVIGDAVDRQPIFHWLHPKDLWNESKGWALTTFSHHYATDDLRADTGYSPHTSPGQCIADALRHPGTHFSVHTRMNMEPSPPPFSTVFGAES